MADDVNVTLTISIAGGAPQQGGLTATLGQSIQLSAASKVGWSGGPTRWEIYDYPPDFAEPAGWDTADDGVYYYLGNDDPPDFDADAWGKYMTRVVVRGSIVDERTAVQVLSPGGLESIARREGNQFGGDREQWVGPLKRTVHGLVDAVDAGGSFNPQAATVNITTTGAAGTTNIGTRAGENVVIGNATGALNVTASGDAFFVLDAAEFTCGSSFAVISTDETSVTCDSFGVTAAGLCGFVAATFAVDAQSGGATISSAATPATAVADVVKLKGDVGVSIRAGTTDPATPASGEVRIHGESLVTIDGIRADYERVTKTDGTTLEAGKLNELTAGTGWTLPALSGVADGESVYVVHPWATSDSAEIVRDGSDVINGGDGHATDTSFALTEFQGRVRFQKVNSQWRVSTEGNANAASAGSGTSISQAGGSVAVDGSGNVEGTAADDQSVSFSATNTGATQSASLSLDGTNGDASLTCTSGVEIGCGVSGNASVRVGNSAYMRCSISGANLRTSWVDAGGATALTIDADNAASSITAVGTLAVTCATSLTETVGSASRTVTASGAAWTDTYSGSWTRILPAGSNLSTTVPENVTWTIGNNWTQNVANNMTLYGGNLCALQAGGVRRVDMGHTSGDRFRFGFPASVTPTTNAATAIGTSTVYASKTVRIRLEIHARVSAGNWTIWQAEFAGDADGTTLSGTLTVDATPLGSAGTVQGTGAGAPLASTDFDVSIAGLVATFRAANADDVPLSINLVNGIGG